MSEQPDGLLQTSSSYRPQHERIHEYRGSQIRPDSFHEWSRSHMYKSTYAHFHSRASTQPKHVAMPGYAGYIPSIKADNLHAKGYSPITKQSFSNSRLGTNVHGLATTGFNVDKKVFVDGSLLASSSKFGKTALQMPHPAWRVPEWTTTAKEFFKDPSKLLPPTYHPTDKKLETVEPMTKTSGYATNHAYMDGKGWKPHAVLAGRNDETEYRNRYNKEKEFHRDVFVTKARSMLKKGIVGQSAIYS